MQSVVQIGSKMWICIRYKQTNTDKQTKIRKTFSSICKMIVTPRGIFHIKQKIFDNFFTNKYIIIRSNRVYDIIFSLILSSIMLVFPSFPWSSYVSSAGRNLLMH